MEKQENKKREIEKCIVCKNDTEYYTDTPIKNRQFYIETAGQLCQKCHYELYVKKGN